MTLYGINGLVSLRYRAVRFSQAQVENRLQSPTLFTVSPEYKFVIRLTAQRYFLVEKYIFIFNRVLNNMFRKM
jgi:hypothetical protein